MCASPYPEIRARPEGSTLGVAGICFLSSKNSRGDQVKMLFIEAHETEQHSPEDGCSFR